MVSWQSPNAELGYLECDCMGLCDSVSVRIYISFTLILFGNNIKNNDSEYLLNVVYESSPILNNLYHYITSISPTTTW